MLKIGLLSDTHGYLDSTIFHFFENCDEIWHAGDFGCLDIADKLRGLTKLRGVYGNIDGEDIRSEFPLHQRFLAEGIDVWMTHIGGVPGRYCLPIREEMENNPPDMFICGHSHRLNVSRDKQNNNLLFVNPGAAGKQGFHQERTIIRFEIHKGNIKNMQVINLSVDEEETVEEHL